LSAFETYIHAEDDLPPLVRAGLLHVQFETIHPYLDGNGRIGRLFVTLALEHWKLLTKRELFALVAEDRGRVLEHAGTSVAAVRLFEVLPRQPIVSVAYVMRQLGTSKPTAGRAVETLEKARVLVEITGKKRDRSWVYQNYLDRLRVGTEIESPAR